MKHNLLLPNKGFLIGALLTCMLSGFGVQAQVKPLYFYNDKQVVDKNRANSYAITGKLSNQDVWMFKRYDLYDNLIETGSYKDEALTIPHGKFIYYMDVGYFNSSRGTTFSVTATRFKANESTYVDGKLEGKRLSFYPTGIIMELETFKNDALNGLYQSYDRKGQVYSQGNYINGKKEGEWMLNYGKKKYVYENDKLISRK